ncbi:copper oxidase [Candidatus Dependentiae bacterium]|nr:copper oxidase [Candidatus Dependentiae bacterium]
MNHLLFISLLFSSCLIRAQHHQQKPALIIPHQLSYPQTSFQKKQQVLSPCGLKKRETKKRPPKLAYSWADPKIKFSPPPPLMGKQMGVVQTLGIPPLGYEMDGNVKVFHLIAQPVEKTIVDERKPAEYDALIPKKNKLEHAHHHSPIVQKIRAWGYNGSTPGPTIEVNEGDRVRIIFKNELPEPTSIHWHGLEIPNDQDGATPETNRPVLPGETFIYEFTLYQSGTLMYHSGFNVMKQDDYGLHGMLIIHPKNYEYKIDRDIAIFLQQWRIRPGNEDPDLVSMDFNWFTFNGFAAPSIPMIKVKQGERVRIRFANVIMMSHPIHIHGYTWKVVGTEGGPIPQSAQWPGNTINVAPGTTRDVEFVAWNPGLWRLHCHKLHHIMNDHGDVPLPIMGHGGMFTIVYVEPKDPNAPWRHPKQDELDLVRDTDGRRKSKQ